MDTTSILNELRREREKINSAISALEGISSDGARGSSPAGTTVRSAGRRRKNRLTAVGRKKLSQMMKKRWEAYRKKKAKAA